MNKIEFNSQDNNTSSDEEEDEEAKVFIYNFIVNLIYR